jgi:hypothetical protein
MTKLNTYISRWVQHPSRNKLSITEKLELVRSEMKMKNGFKDFQDRKYFKEVRNQFLFQSIPTIQQQLQQGRI